MEPGDTTKKRNPLAEQFEVEEALSTEAIAALASINCKGNFYNNERLVELTAEQLKTYLVLAFRSGVSSTLNAIKSLDKAATQTPEEPVLLTGGKYGDA